MSPYTSTGFGLERPLILKVQPELGFFGGVFFVFCLYFKQ